MKIKYQKCLSIIFNANVISSSIHLFYSGSLIFFNLTFSGWQSHFSTVFNLVKETVSALVPKCFNARFEFQWIIQKLYWREFISGVCVSYVLFRYMFNWLLTFRDSFSSLSLSLSLALSLSLSLPLPASSIAYKFLVSPVYNVLWQLCDRCHPCYHSITAYPLIDPNDLSTLSSLSVLHEQIHLKYSFQVMS